MKLILKLIIKFIIGFTTTSIIFVIIYKFIIPPVTPLMIIRVIEGLKKGELVQLDYQIVNYAEVSQHFLRAVISAEDARFLSHQGIDWKAVEAAQKYNQAKKGKRLRGASTISMQTAKNTFLWQDRNYFRKALEIYFTYLIEFIWGKKRILEIYVNVIELGNGIYGIASAAEFYFNKNCFELSKRQSALIAAILPNPRRWSAAKPTKYIEKRANFIQSRLNAIALPK